MKLLILGGTADARHLTQAIYESCTNVELVYSVAGLVRLPRVPATVISGGFTQHGGLAAYCSNNQIDAVLNATHPFSSHMGHIASQACTDLGIHYWRFLRPQWQRQHGDDWQFFSDRSALIQALGEHQRIMLTLGQVCEAELTQLSECQIWLRTAVEPKFTLPNNVTWIKAIGPFAEADEKSLLKQHQIQVIASKNSGGAATEAKLSAARLLNLPILMLQRPTVSGPVEMNFDALVGKIAQHTSHTAQHTKGTLP